MPEHLGKKDAGKVRRAPRVEVEAWKALHKAAFPVPIAFVDFGVISPRYVKPGRPVNVPARVRYTTYSQLIFLRTGRGGHGNLCRQLVAMEEYAEAAYSAGDQRMKVAAQGWTGPGSPATWLAGDLNHHLELVSVQVWDVLKDTANASRYSFPEPRRYPWLQPDLIE